MVVSAVNGVKFNTQRNNITFRGEADTAPKHEPKRASNLVKVPVIVMMTLSPSLLNSAGATAENYKDADYPQTELLAMATPEPQSTSRTTQGVPREVSSEKVQYKRNFSSNGTQYTMYWVNPTKNGDQNNNYVKEVYLIPNGYQSSSEKCPPQLDKIRLHEVPGQGAFVGAIVREKKANQNWYQREIKLPDEVANQLMDLVEGKTRFKVIKNSPLDKMFYGANMLHSTSSALMQEEYRK